MGTFQFSWPGMPSMSLPTPSPTSAGSPAANLPNPAGNLGYNTSNYASGQAPNTGGYVGSNSAGANFQLQSQSSGNNVYQGGYNLGAAPTANNPASQQAYQNNLNNWLNNPYQSPGVAQTAPGYNNFNGTSSNVPMSPYGVGNSVPLPTGYSSQFNAGPMAGLTPGSNNFAQVPYAGTPGPSNGPNPGFTNVSNNGNIPAGDSGYNQIGAGAGNNTQQSPQTPQGQAQPQANGAPISGGSGSINNGIVGGGGQPGFGGTSYAQGPYTNFGGYNGWGSPQQGNPYSYMTGVSNNGLNGQQIQYPTNNLMQAAQAQPAMYSQQPLSFGYGNMNPLTQNGSMAGLSGLYNNMMGLNPAQLAMMGY